jgi:hypothetical protein
LNQATGLIMWNSQNGTVIGYWLLGAGNSYNAYGSWLSKKLFFDLLLKLKNWGQSKRIFWKEGRVGEKEGGRERREIMGKIFPTYIWF